MLEATTQLIEEGAKNITPQHINKMKQVILYLYQLKLIQTLKQVSLKNTQILIQNSDTVYQVSEQVIEQALQSQLALQTSKSLVLEGTKQTGLKLGSYLGKAIPFVSLGISIPTAISQYRKGNYGIAALSMGGGVASCIPALKGASLALSIGTLGLKFIKSGWFRKENRETAKTSKSKLVSQNNLKKILLIQKQFDIEFIVKQEGYKLEGYVPSDDSGVTISVGYDLKKKTIQNMKKFDMPKQLIDKLKNYIGLSGNQARKEIEKNPLVLTKEQAECIKICMLIQYSERTKKLCKDYNINFDSLPKQIKTIMLARIIHSWNVPDEFFKALAKKDYKKFAGIVKQHLQKRKFNSRGGRECQYILKNVKIQ